MYRARMGYTIDAAATQRKLKSLAIKLKLLKRRVLVPANKGIHFNEYAKTFITILRKNRKCGQDMGNMLEKATEHILGIHLPISCGHVCQCAQP